MIDYALNNGPAMQVGKFLVPAVAVELKLTIQDLKKLKPLITKLDVEHIYEEAIYEAYIENNGFSSLTSNAKRHSASIGQQGLIQ